MQLKRLTTTFIVVASATLLSAACGSSKNDLSGSTTCSPGDTRTCVGPGACKGGQTCGNDGSWSGCDCGGSGSGGNGGSAGSAAGGASASGGSGGVVQADGGGGSAGDASAGDATSDGQVIQKDPCPTANQTVLDCSYECVTGKCSAYDGCQGEHYADVQTLPAYMRTPDHPGTSPNCTCGDGGCTCDVAYGFATGVAVDVYPQPASLKISVGPPWRLRLFNALQPNWCGYAQAGSCLTGPNPKSFGLYVMTNDPDAPARNILIEDGTGKSCP